MTTSRASGESLGGNGGGWHSLFGDLCHFGSACFHCFGLAFCFRLLTRCLILLQSDASTELGEFFIPPQLQVLTSLVGEVTILRHCEQRQTNLVLQYLGCSGIGRNHFGRCTRLSHNCHFLLFGDALLLFCHFVPAEPAPLPGHRGSQPRCCLCCPCERGKAPPWPWLK
jgi:hypothetical protein